MRKKLTAIVLVFGLLVFAGSQIQSTTSAYSTEPFKPDRNIPIDLDPYYKSLKGNTVLAEVTADTLKVESLLQSSKEYVKSGIVTMGVGDVAWLYADGWRDFTLWAIDGNAEIWVANDLSYAPGDPRPPDVVTQEQIDYLLEEFNGNIYPSLTTFFGYTNDRDGTTGLFYSWGYDWYETVNPQRVIILVYNIIDENYYDPDYPTYLPGYFWPTMNDYYADRNIIYLDSYDWSNTVGPDAGYPHFMEQVLCHEYEHAIHYDHDPDESLWVDEGIADLSPYLAGYGHISPHIAYYLVYHRASLTSWTGGLDDYGASYLFQLYLLENFGGPDFIRALIDEPANGVEGIENQLATSGYSVSFDDIYDDWIIANYLDDSSKTGNSGAKLGYDGLDIPSADTWGYSIQWSIKNHYGSDNQGNLPLPRYWGGYKSETVQYPAGTLLPYTPMYLAYKGFSPQLISTFRADKSTGIFPHSGNYELWGGRGDLLFNAAALAAPLDLGSSAELRFWTYYEIEESWDFGFIQISTDGGATWTSLDNSDTTYDHNPAAHPEIVVNLPGFTGKSEDWVQQSFDLSSYAGQSVMIRFLYMTDWAYSENGFYIDDISITDDSGTLLFDDFEVGSSNWVLYGWLHTTGVVENDWNLIFINPIYEKGRFSHHDIQEGNPFIYDNYQWDLTILNTQWLNRDEVTIIVTNHLPESMSSPAECLLLVEKGNAKP